MEFAAQDFAALGVWLDHLSRREGFWTAIATVSVIALILAHAFFGRQGQSSPSDGGAWSGKVDRDGEA